MKGVWGEEKEEEETNGVKSKGEKREREKEEKRRKKAEGLDSDVADDPDGVRLRHSHQVTRPNTLKRLLASSPALQKTSRSSKLAPSSHRMNRNPGDKNDGHSSDNTLLGSESSSHRYSLSSSDYETVGNRRGRLRNPGNLFRSHPGTPTRSSYRDRPTRERSRSQGGGEASTPRSASERFFSGLRRAVNHPCERHFHQGYPRRRTSSAGEYGLRDYSSHGSMRMGRNRSWVSVSSQQGSCKAVWLIHHHRFVIRAW